MTYSVNLATKNDHVETSNNIFETYPQWNHPPPPLLREDTFKENMVRFIFFWGVLWGISMVLLGTFWALLKYFFGPFLVQLNDF